ncbi:hypothetical protein ACQ4PT_050623 [Festuca glaucescens]
MQAPPLAALAGGAWASHRPAILAAPASLRRSRRGALRLPAWRAAGGGRAPRVPAKGAVLASDMGAEEVVGPSPLLDARSEQELVLRIRKEVEKGKLPADVAHNFENLFYNYKNAVLKNGDPNAHQIILSNMMDLFERVLLDVEVLPSMPVIFSILLSHFLLCSKAPVTPLFCRINLHFNLITRPSENHLTITLSVRTTLGHW